MANLKIKLDKTFNPASTNQTMRAVKKDFNDVVLDLRMVSQSLTPKLSGKLEHSATSKVSMRGDEVVGKVGYYAKSSRGYNYARKMHDGEYKLGKESRKKRAIKSKFAKGTLTVGPGFLTKTAQQSRDGYVKHLQEKTVVALKTSKLLKGYKNGN